MSEPTPLKGIPRVLSWAKHPLRDPAAVNPLVKIGRRTPDEDAAALSLRGGDAVTITSDYGVAEATAQVTDRVAPRMLFATFHFPESGINNVTSDGLHRLSDRPEYKLTGVTLAPRLRNVQRDA